MALGLRAPDPYTPVIESTMKEQERLGGALERVYEGEERRLQERRTQTAPVYESIRKELAQPAPQPPQTQDVPQYQPKQISGQDMSGFAMIAMAFAALGTKAMRGDITMAMNAAAGAIKGFNEGALEQSALEMKQFDEKIKGVIAQNNQLMAKYNSIMESRKYSLQQKTQLLSVIAHENQDEAMIAAMKTGRLEHALQRNQSMMNHSMQLQQRADAIRIAHEDRVAQMAQTRELAMARMASSEHGRKAGLTDEAIDNAAAYYILNGRMPVGMARIGQSAIEAIQNRAGEMTKKVGMTPEEFAAAGPVARQKLGALMQLEKMRNAVQSYEGMLDLNIDILKDLSKKVDRTDSPYANRPILWLKQNAAGDPDVAEYLFQVNTVATEIARILNNPNLTGQLTDTARQELEGVVSGNFNQKQLIQVLDRAQGDARNRSAMLDKQVDKVIKEVRDPLHKSSGGENVQRSKSKSGKPIVSKDGGKTWEYE